MQEPGCEENLLTVASSRRIWTVSIPHSVGLIALCMMLVLCFGLSSLHLVPFWNLQHCLGALIIWTSCLAQWRSMDN